MHVYDHCAENYTCLLTNPRSYVVGAQLDFLILDPVRLRGRENVLNRYGEL